MAAANQESKIAETVAILENELIPLIIEEILNDPSKLPFNLTRHHLAYFAKPRLSKPDAKNTNPSIEKGYELSMMIKKEFESLIDEFDKLNPIFNVLNINTIDKQISSNTINDKIANYDTISKIQIPKTKVHPSLLFWYSYGLSTEDAMKVKVRDCCMITHIINHILVGLNTKISQFAEIKHFIGYLLSYSYASKLHKHARENRACKDYFLSMLNTSKKIGIEIGLPLKRHYLSFLQSNMNKDENDKNKIDHKLVDAGNNVTKSWKGPNCSFQARFDWKHHMSYRLWNNDIKIELSKWFGSRDNHRLENLDAAKTSFDLMGLDWDEIIKHKEMARTSLVSIVVNVQNLYKI